MNVWYHLSTIFSQRRVLQIAGLLTLCVALITTLFLSSISKAAPGINQTISFQGRLLTSQGQPVAEGYYNIQFKIYEGGPGTAAGNPGGTLKWTETYINDGSNSGVYIKNGYMSVDLGSLNAFGSQVDWNQDTLWLSMNIAGSSTLCEEFGTAPCLADGEMTPMKRLTSAPYALNAGKVGGKSADDLIHNGTSQQTGNFNISGTGTANILQGSSGVIAPLLDRADAGILSIGATNATVVAIGTTTGASGTLIQGGSLGVGIETTGGFGLKNVNSDLYAFSMSSTGNLTLRLGSGNVLDVKDGSNESLLTIADTGELTIKGETTVDNNLFVNGAIIMNAPNGTDYAGLSWFGGSTMPRLGTTTDALALQGNGVDLLTTRNTSGKATVGIGNAASSGYALDVTGEINASATYKINGVDVLGSNNLAFSGAAGSGFGSTNGDGLRLYSNDGIKIGDGVASGQPTLLTLDKSSSTPTATGDAVLGSMYYDTTLGKVQCYEADGWGDCSSSPDNFVHLNPEYSNAVVSEGGDGTFASGFCSEPMGIAEGTTNGTDTPCSTDETYNYYSWTSTGDEETKDIYVTYQLPANFTGFVEESTSLVGRVNDIMAGTRYQIYKNTSSGLVACGSSINVGNSLGQWEKVVATGSADPANCNFTANDSLVVKITLMSSDSFSGDAYAYASTLSFAFSNQ